MATQRPQETTRRAQEASQEVFEKLYFLIFLNFGGESLRYRLLHAAAAGPPGRGAASVVACH